MIKNIYFILHKNAKKLLGKTQNINNKIGFFYIYEDLQYYTFINKENSTWFINDRYYDEHKVILSKSDLFFGENVTSYGTQIEGCKVLYPDNAKSLFIDVEEAWLNFISNAMVPYGWRNSGFMQTGYVLHSQEWSLSSWIWTSAAVVRCFLKLGKIDQAKMIVEAYLKEQLSEGGWIVRYDFNKEKVIPVIAPNDSAYIASNAFLELYLIEKDKRYLLAAEKTAKWIMNTAKLDGLVHFGYNPIDKNWITDVNIVDIGFTPDLFVKLFNITHNEEYRIFAIKFVNAYIEKFYNNKVSAFATSIDRHEKQQGGLFARGQAWALEGLIPVYKLTQDNTLRKIIEDSVNYIIQNQLKNGAWPYNFTKLLMGTDCKGTSVIANSLLEWYKVDSDNDKILNSVIKALNWCKNNTSLDGESSGGIFSKSVEGSVVHSLYTSTAFVYASAYALEVSIGIKEIKQ